MLKSLDQSHYVPVTALALSARGLDKTHKGKCVAGLFAFRISYEGNTVIDEDDDIDEDDNVSDANDADNEANYDDNEENDDDNEDDDSKSQGILETGDRCLHILMTHSYSTASSS